MLSMSKLTRSVVLIFPAILSAQKIAILQHPLPSSHGQAMSVALGSDGAVWYANQTSQIGRITTAGAITAFSVTGDPVAIIAGPDGALWFAESIANQIGRITTTGAVTYFPVSGNPAGITAGPDGALWFTELEGSAIGRITTAGAVTVYPVPNIGENAITTGPDGALWFTEATFSVPPYGNQIGRITTSGVVTQFSIPTPQAGLGGIVTGPDGALWFCESFANKIGRITTSGAVSEFSAATPEQITANLDGNLWFTQAKALGSITTAGTVTEYPVSSGQPGQGITALPNGALWFADLSRVNQVIIETATLSAGSTSTRPGTMLPVNGSGFASGEIVDFFLNSTGSGFSGSSTSGTDGLIAAMVEVPPLPYGAGWSVIAVGETSRKIAVAPFSVTARVDIAPGTYSPGSSASATAFGFTQGETVQLFFGSPRAFLGEATTDAYGSITPVMFTIPAGAQPGENVIIGQEMTFRVIARGYLEVQ